MWFIRQYKKNIILRVLKEKEDIIVPIEDDVNIISSGKDEYILGEDNYSISQLEEKGKEGKEEKEENS